jgi:non-ribosomal peptide synthetase component E (peptide arylation enzyme)
MNRTHKDVSGITVERSKEIMLNTVKEALEVAISSEHPYRSAADGALDFLIKELAALCLNQEQQKQVVTIIKKHREFVYTVDRRNI